VHGRAVEPLDGRPDRDPTVMDPVQQQVVDRVLVAGQRPGLRLGHPGVVVVLADGDPRHQPGDEVLLVRVN
jgi:hypothetical protein